MLVMHFHPTEHAEGLATLARTGRLIIAAPDSGPVPLVLDIDPEELLALLA